MADSGAAELESASATAGAVATTMGFVATTVGALATKFDILVVGGATAVTSDADGVSRSEVTAAAEPLLPVAVGVALKVVCGDVEDDDFRAPRSSCLSVLVALSTACRTVFRSESATLPTGPLPELGPSLESSAPWLWVVEPLESGSAPAIAVPGPPTRRTVDTTQAPATMLKYVDMATSPRNA